jgi:DNA modification methylase
MNLGTARVIQGDARHLPLADNTVDLVVTSPPYFALRSYQDGGEHYAGQLGSEATPAEFVAALLEVTRECVRVLKPTGSLWVNLGDSYSSGGRATRAPDTTTRRRGFREDSRPRDGMRAKTLIGIPWRYALACIDDLGLILRAEVIWSKPNGLPESVTDRVRRSHEQWFHFTLEPRYFSAVDEIRETYTESSLSRARYATIAGPEGGTNGKSNGTLRSAREPGTSNPLGKLPGSVWTIPTEPLQVPDHLGIDHFAAFPSEWPRRIIQGWSPAGVCVQCGEGRRPVTHKKPMEWRPGPKAGGYELDGASRKVVSGTMLAASETTITGYACACTPRTSHRGKRGDWREGRDVMPEHGSDDFHQPGNAVPRRPGGFGTKVPPSAGEWEYHFDDWAPAPTTPAVVLDPFGGTGTTALVAKALGRHAITVDMSSDYCRLAEWRTNDRDSLAKVLGIAKADAPDDSQLDLFGEATA